MRIALISRWNATCGVSLHAELVARELMERGHSVVVFAPDLESAGRWWHHKVVREDEQFVRRVYKELSPSGEEGSLDVERVLAERFDVLVVESYEKLPYGDVCALVESLKDRGVPSVAVVHEGLKEDIGYDLNLFDRVVVFDSRYRKEVVTGVDEEKVVEIPYPCLPPVGRKRRFAEGGRIVFASFGRQPPEEYEDFFRVLRRVRKEYPQILYRIVRSGEPLHVKESWVVQESRVLDPKGIYELLGTSDIHLLPKGDTEKVVVSSTFCQTVGSLCPVVSRRSRFFETLDTGGLSPIALYSNREDLEALIHRLIEKEDFRNRLIQNMRSYAEKNSVKVVADRFEDLLNSVLVEYL
ncbi:MAG: glycosyltransferase [Aquificota bacterium]|nr:glycosyltransferase [Aquificota bacterium]